MTDVGGQRSARKTGAKPISKKITGLALCALLFALSFPLSMIRELFPEGCSP